MTLQDCKEKFEFVIKEYERIRIKKLNKSNIHNNFNNLKFEKKKLLKNSFLEYLNKFLSEYSLNK